jgi:transcription initiation factor TFIIF subunit beta
MDAIVVDDEKKPFDAEGPQEEETLPDPDEQLMLDQGNGRVWLVKVCAIVGSCLYAGR